jgi:hypothetical protein
MRNILSFSVIITLALALGSCSYFKKDNICEDVMEKEKFVEIITDLYLLEAHFETFHQHKIEDFQDSLSIYYNALFHKHQVTKEQIHEAINCYVLERKMINQIHDEIINSLSLMEEKSNEEK